jgi:hypothetical protein
MSYWVRANWRDRRAALIGLTLLATLSFGAVATAFAGARRTASSFERMRRADLAYDHGIVIDAPDSYPDKPTLDRYAPAVVQNLAQLPVNAGVGPATMYIASLPDADWEFSVVAPEDNNLGTTVEHDRILRGRWPDRDRADEVVVNEATVDQAHIDVGGWLDLVTLTPRQRTAVINGDPHAFDHGPLGPKLHLHVVGVGRASPDVVGRPNPTIIATNAFDARYRGRIAYTARLLLVRRAAGVSSAGFHNAVERLVPKTQLGVFDSHTEDKPAIEATTTLARGLLVFALVAALIAILALGQATGRHLANNAIDEPTLMAMGMSRADRIGALMLSIAPVAIVGAVGAVAVSWFASASMPIGIARRIEPSPGLRFDPLIAAGTVGALLAVVLVAAFIAAWRLTATTRHGSVRRSSVVAATLGSAGASPVVTTGVGLAFSRRPPAPPVRSALLGLSATVLVLVGALTFSKSLDRVTHEPQRWGFNWDLMLDTDETGSKAMITDVVHDPRVAAAGMLATNFTVANGKGIRAWGIESLHGKIGYALLSGTNPISADEMVIGPGTKRELHARIGTTLRVAECPCIDNEPSKIVPVRVVGIALFPEDDDGNFNNALGFSGVGFKHHVPEGEPPRVAVVVANGQPVAAVASDLRRRYPGNISQYSYPTRPGEVQNLVGLRTFPKALFLFAGLLGIVVLANLLFASARRRRRDLATLRSMGLTPRQTAACIVWESLSVVVVAIVIGVPLGLLAGAGVWIAATHGVGIADDLYRPFVPLAILVIGILLAALATSVLPGWTASRQHLGNTLNRE